jgi:hypothetical protein
MGPDPSHTGGSTARPYREITSAMTLEGIAIAGMPGHTHCSDMNRIR